MPQQLTGPQQTSSTRRAGRIDALTGVRIVAAAAVFLSHAGAPEFAPASLKTFMAAGYNGVTLFFVLSGFVLAWNYGDRMSRLTPGNVWSFAVARVARIYPVYLLALLWVAAPIVVTSGVPEDLWVHAAALQAWDSDIQVAYGYNGPAWSISVEFFLYACFPLLILALGPIRRNSRGLLIVAGIALAVVVGLAWWFAAVRVEPAWGAPGGSHRWLYRMPLTRLGDFTIGACLALRPLRYSPEMVRDRSPDTWRRQFRRPHVVGPTLDDGMVMGRGLRPAVGASHLGTRRESFDVARPFPRVEADGPVRRGIVRVLPASSHVHGSARA